MECILVDHNENNTTNLRDSEPIKLRQQATDH